MHPPRIDGPVTMGNVKEESVRLTEAESHAPHATMPHIPQPSTQNLIVTATPTGAQRPILTLEGGGQMPTLHLVGQTAMWAVTPAPVAPGDGDDETRGTCQ